MPSYIYDATLDKTSKRSQSKIMEETEIVVTFRDCVSSEMHMIYYEGEQENRKQN